MWPNLIYIWICWFTVNFALHLTTVPDQENLAITRRAILLTVLVLTTLVAVLFTLKVVGN